MAKQTKLAVAVRGAVGTSQAGVNAAFDTVRKATAYGDDLAAVYTANGFLFGRDVLAESFSAEQVDAMEGIAGEIMWHSQERENFHAAVLALAPTAFPRPLSWADWKIILRVFKDDAFGLVAKVPKGAHRPYSTSAAWRLQVLREAYLSVHAALPSAGDKRASGGKKGASPGKWMQGTRTAADALLERMDTLPDGALTPARVAALTDAVCALMAEISAAERAIAKAA